MDLSIAKNPIRLLWTDVCTIIGYADYLDADEATQQIEIPIIENEPCKLSYQSLNTVNQTDTAATISQTAKLFIDENVIIPPGSKIIVNDTLEFKQSGEAGRFVNHQEIMLIPVKDYA